MSTNYIKEGKEKERKREKRKKNICKWQATYNVIHIRNLQLCDKKAVFSFILQIYVDFSS